MSSERNGIGFNLEKSWEARRKDLLGHFQAYLDGLWEVEEQSGRTARVTRRIFKARLAEIERQQLEPILGSRG